jgi:hypothetical protein
LIEQEIAVLGDEVELQTQLEEIGLAQQADKRSPSFVQWVVAGSLADELDFAIMHRVPKATTSQYLRRLDRHGSGDGERCCR